MRKRLFYGVCFAVIVGLAGFGLYAWHPAIDPITPPSADQFSQEMIDQGEVLAAAGYCSTCHTSPGRQPYAGNYAMHTGFGTIYSSNITPDPDTGIGRWSEEAFIRAMRTGVSRDGHHLLPAFPYEHFNKMTDHDLKAIYAYIMTSVPAVEKEKKANDIPFPLNMRWLQAGWKLLFADTSSFKPDPQQSEQWNRGAYLAEGVAHCGACHTPRNAVGAEQYDQMYEGASIDGWIAPALTMSNPSPLPWRQQDFYTYLRTGHSRLHGSAAGPMAPVVHDGLAALPDQDIQAISLYLADGKGPQEVGDAALDEQSQRVLQKALNDQATIPDTRLNEGARLYATACSSCHYNGQHLVKGRPLLTIDSSTHLEAPTNLVNVILDGLRADQGLSGVVMPGFRDALSDAEIAQIAAYLRHTAGEPPWPNLQQQVTDIRQQPRFEH